MERRVILIVGLPGSGKTHLGRKLAIEKNSVLIDDPSDWDYDVLRHVKNLEPVLVVTDPQLCITKARKTAEDRFMSLGYTVSWIFFDNDPAACLANAKRRPDKKVNEDIKWFSKQYKIPKGVEVLPVWRAN